MKGVIISVCNGLVAWSTLSIIGCGSYYLMETYPDISVYVLVVIMCITPGILVGMGSAKPIKKRKKKK